MGGYYIMADLYTRYFMFSQEHMRKTKELARANGDMNPIFGKVLVSGQFKTYTNMTNDPNAYTRRYPDARTLVSGDIRQIKYEAGEY